MYRAATLSFATVTRYQGPTFLASHERWARPGYFIAGTRVHLPELLHESLTDSDILNGRVFDYDFLHARWDGCRRYRRRLAPGCWEGLLNLISYRHCVFHGCNASAWHKDLVLVNGFDESLWLRLRRPRTGRSAEQCRLSFALAKVFALSSAPGPQGGRGRETSNCGQPQTISQATFLWDYAG